MLDSESVVINFGRWKFVPLLETEKGQRRPSGVTTMFDKEIARIRAHRNNIYRYRRLLKTRLSDLERQFIERRLSEEQAAAEALFSESFPVTSTLPKARPRSRGRRYDRRSATC
ncbi:hypothetical protein [Bradyrhizobium sp. USDA 3364]